MHHLPYTFILQQHIHHWTDLTMKMWLSFALLSFLRLTFGVVSQWNSSVKQLGADEG